eukprot:TRINITY_DN28200_c0_g1_i2.p1 TRINITY_DN28200_c0_g1~~TRINITY_DN28200_c0_g1_i2.p1  ORF type:complete len:928 (-),score=190.48 TRINITY_DN28200_c0_g1_i2:49-2832(-)
MAVSQVLEPHCQSRQKRQLKLRPHVPGSQQAACEPRTASQASTCPSCDSAFGPDASQCRTCGRKRELAVVCPSCSNAYAPDSNFCRKCGLRRPELEEVRRLSEEPAVESCQDEVHAADALRRKEVLLRAGASFLGHLLRQHQRSYLQHWHEASRCPAALDRSPSPSPLAPADEVQESCQQPFEGLTCLSSVLGVSAEEDEEEAEREAEESEDALPNWQQPLRDFSRAGVREWARLRFLGRTVSAWLSAASDGRSRRLVRKVCTNYRARVLSTRAFAAFAAHWQQRQARGAAISQVVEQWTTERLLEKILEALRIWRSRAAKGSIRCRGGKLLSRWVEMNCCRRFLNDWSTAVTRKLRISDGLNCLHAEACRKQQQKALVTWQLARKRSLAAAAVAEHFQRKQATAAVVGWAGIRKANVQHFCHLASAAWRGWCSHCRRAHTAATLRSRCRKSLVRHALRRWDTAAKLVRREQDFQLQFQAGRLRRMLGSWAHLNAASAYAAQHLASDTLCAWRAVVGHLTCERIEREQTILGSALRASASSQSMTIWQRKQCSRRLGHHLLAWQKATVQKKMRRDYTADAEQCLKKQAAARALWSWHEGAKGRSRQRDHIQRASIALTAMVAASRWARAHDALVLWSNRAKATRMKCDTSVLSPGSAKAPTAAVALGAQELQRLMPSPPRRTLPLPKAAKGWSPLRSPEVSFISPHPLQQQWLPSPASSSWAASETPPAAKLSVLGRWLKWTMALWLGNAAALPVLQWSMSLWRGALLCAELRRLRWWSLITKHIAIRKVERRKEMHRLCQTFSAWWDATAKSLREAVEAAAAELMEVRARSKSIVLEPVPPEKDVPPTKEQVTDGQLDCSEVLREQIAPDGLTWASLHAAFAAWAGLGSHTSAFAKLDALPVAGEGDVLLWAFSNWVVWAQLQRAC